MMFRQTRKIYQNFARLKPPNIGKFNSFYDLMRDRSNQLKFIDSFNKEKINTNRNFTLQQSLQKKFGLSQNHAKDIAKNTAIHTNTFSPILMNSYKIIQQLNSQIKFQDPIDNIEGLYLPGHINLKYHYSINKHIPIYQQYNISKQIIYLFNLPKNTTQASLYEQIDKKFTQKPIKNISFKYCMLGLPAYFKLQLTQKFSKQKYYNQLIYFLQNKNILVVTEQQKFKLPLNRRQIVIKGIGPNQTPASMLQKLSVFGRVMNLNLPLETYKHQSIKQIKQLYKNQKFPIKLNYYKKDGTIQSQYYPPFQPMKQQISLFAQKQEQYNRRLRYCQNVNIYQGREGKIQTKTKDFCIVTFSCQEQTQNCYFSLRCYYRMQVLNGKQQFEFDKSHYEALLRFIDNYYIQQCKKNNPYKDYKKYEQKLDSKVFQQLFLTLVYQRLEKNMKKPRKTKQSQQNPLSEQQQIKLHYNYKRYLDKLHDSIGMNNLHQQNEQSLNNYKNFHQNNMYGKSFDDLAQQQLFSMKLKQNQKQQKYQVNIDDYICPEQQPQLTVKKKKLQYQQQQQQQLQLSQKKKQQYLQKQQQQQQQYFQQQQQQQQQQQNVNQVEDDFPARRDLHKLQDQDLYEGKRKFGMKIKKIMLDRGDAPQSNTSIGKRRKRKQAYIKRLKENWEQISTKYKQQMYQDENQSEKDHDQDYQQQIIQGQQQQAPQQQQKQQKQQKQQQQQLQKQPSTQSTNKIKKKFSTMRTIKNQYRPKTFQQKVSCHMKYNKFVRNTINQYMGIFPADQLQSEFHKKKPNFVNPQSLKFINGDQFITQQQVTHILKYTNQKAQQKYNQFFIYNQLAKSMNIDIEQDILKNMQQNLSKALYYYSQIGEVKQQFNYQGEDIKQAVKKLNIESKLGEQYKIVTDQNGNSSIAKIGKIEHIFPLYLEQKFRQKIQQQFEKKKKQTNRQVFSQQLMKLFTVKQQQIQQPKQQQFQPLIQQICHKFNLSKKDFQKFMNLKNYSQQQISKDIQSQILISNTKKKLQQKKPSDYSRDPSEINVRDRNYKAVVSKFRQI